MPLISLILAALLPAVAAASCGDPATPIHRIQSDGTRSPLAGQTVTVEGIVTRDAREPGGFNGFYLQQADHETDNNPATSEALFIYTRKKAGKPGQRLRVTGTVKEFHGLTELVAVRNLKVCGAAPLPEPVEVSLPWPEAPEHLENMRVRFSQPLTIIDHYNLARYGELTLASSDQVTPTEYLPPGAKAVARSQRNQRNRVLLDDGKSQRQPNPVPWLNNLAGDAPLRAGDRVTRLEGVLDFRFSQWRLQPSVMPRFQRNNPRPDAPPAPARDHVRVMALNLQNFFNGNGRGNGFPTPRGAESLQQLDVQALRLRSAILQAKPDILAVSELENRSEEHTSELQSRPHLVCRLLLEKKKRTPQSSFVASPYQLSSTNDLQPILSSTSLIRPPSPTLLSSSFTPPVSCSTWFPHLATCT